MKMKLSRPTPERLGMCFKELTNCEAPARNKTYECHTEAPVRAIAEYEDMGGVVLAYPGTIAPPAGHTQLAPTGPRTFGVPDDLIIKMQQLNCDSKPVHIFILCDDENEKSKIISNLQRTADEQKLPFDPNLIHLIPWDTDTYWTRDYSPWWIKYKDREEYGIAKHIYTSLGGGAVGKVEGAENLNAKEGSGIFRCNDDYGAVKISDFFNTPIRKWNNAKWSDGSTLEPIPAHKWFFTGLLNVGGNYMVTSNGVLASSYLVATQNELPTDVYPESKEPSEETLDKRMHYIMEQSNRFLGANTYHVFTDPTGTYIGHIDCWAKFLSDKKALVAESEDPAINEAFDVITNYLKAAGFQVYRVLCPNIYVPGDNDEPATTAPYTNSLILNKYVYVPLAGGKYSSHDNNAINKYQEALGNEYKVVGVIGKPETPWLGTDALHCRTNTIPRAIVDRWLKSLGVES